MERIRIQDVVKAVNGEILKGNIENKYISSVATDSRENMNNGLFVAIKGEKTDGHKYIKNAVENGAVSVFISDELDEYLDNVVYIKVKDTIKALQDLATWYRLKFNIPVIAITGSVGKTTTKDMIATVLAKKYKVLKTQGNFNSDIGAPLTILGLNTEHEIAVIEMGMDRAGQIDTISSIVRPSIAVITNIGVAHIEYLGSRENILKAKCEVFNNLNIEGTAILNADDDMLIKVENDFNKIWYSRNANSDIQAKEVFVDYKEGTVVAKIAIQNEEYKLEIPGLSEHLVYAAMSAIAVGMKCNMNIEEILEGIKNYKATKMRMDIYKLDSNSLLIDDTYNANPDSMKSLINTVSKANVSNKIMILGDMFELGENSLKLHMDVLEYALESNIDKIVVTGENMNKAAKRIDDNRIIAFDNKEEIIQNIAEILCRNSIIAIKASRGMKFENITEKILAKYNVL